MDNENLINSPAGLAVNERGIPQSKYCDSFITAVAETSGASGVILRLHHAGAQTNVSGSKVTSDQAQQFVMTADRARKLAAALINACDEIEGVGHVKQ